MTRSERRSRRLLGLLAAGLVLALGGLVAKWWGGFPPLPGRAPLPSAPEFGAMPLPADHRDSLLVWRADLPGPLDETWFEQALATFALRFPRIRVVVEALPPHEAAERLARALGEGNPPDLYLDSGSPLFTPHPLRVPLEPFLRDGHRQAYLPVAWQAVTRAGRAWAWPAWIWPRLVVGNGPRLEEVGLSVRQIQREGWSWERAGRALPTGGSAGSWGLVINPAGGQFLLELAATAAGLSGGAPGPEVPGADAAGDGDPGALETSARLVTAARWLESLEQTRVAPRRERADGRAVALFLAGEAAVLAGANPLLARWLVAGPVLSPPEAPRPAAPESTGDAGGAAAQAGPIEPWPGPWYPPAWPEAVLLPLPRPDGSFRPVLSAGGYAVFRQVPYRGGRHTQAAVELARHLSGLGSPEAAGLALAVPAAVEAFEAWREAPPLPARVAGYLVSTVERAVETGFDLPADPPPGDVAEAFLRGRLHSDQLAGGPEGPPAGLRRVVPVLRLWPGFRQPGGQDPARRGRIAEGVRVGSHDLSGLEPEAARDLLLKLAAQRLVPAADAHPDPGSGTVVPALNGAELDVDATLEAARKARPGTAVQPRWRQVAPRRTLPDFPTLPVRAGNPGKPAVTLAVNVAWGDDHLEPLLDVLDQHAVKATFFLVGRWVRSRPDLARAIAGRGHEIANHGDSDSVEPAKLTPDELRRDIRAAAESIARVTGTTTRYYSPHLGEWNRQMARVAYDTGHRLVLWSVDTIDWQEPPPATVVRRVVRGLHPGAIILMHPTAATVQALPDLIAEFRKRGLKAVPLDTLLDPALPESLLPSLDR